MLPSNDTKKEKLKDSLLGLHWASITGNVGLVKFALDHGVSIDSVVNGFVPLQLACINDNNIAVVQYLIDRGADVNMQKWSKKQSTDKTQAVQGATGSTALHVACANGCVRIVDLLIRNHARVDIRDKYGSTPLDIAQAKHETEIINLLKAAKLAQHDDYKFKKEHKHKLRRPSLPSIMEGKHIPFTTMTPQQLSRRSFSGTHRPSSMDEIVTQQQDNNHNRSSSSIPLSMSSNSSDDSSHISPLSLTDSDVNSDWYGHGVVNNYDEDNYLLSLERRAFNLDVNEDGQLERHSQDMTRKSHDQTSSSDDELDDEERYQNEPYMYNIDQPEMKKNWFGAFSGKESNRNSLNNQRNFLRIFKTRMA